MPRSLPRDTPVDTPAAGALIEAPELGGDAAALCAEALSRARSHESLEVAYAAWDELRLAHAASLRRALEEHRRLTEQGELLLGAVRAAGGSGAEAGLARQTELDGFLAEARRKLDDARAELERRAAEAEALFLSGLGALRAEVQARVRRQASSRRPLFRLAIQRAGADRRILHAHRLGADESVVALWALTGRVPSRYDYLFDDSTDDALAAPPVLYADEGVAERRPPTAELVALLESRAEVWPVKGMLPLQLADQRWLRWISRGAVLEAELLDADGFRNLLTQREAEEVTGLLLSHKLGGRIELELARE